MNIREQLRKLINAKCPKQTAIQQNALSVCARSYWLMVMMRSQISEKTWRTRREVATARDRFVTSYPPAAPAPWCSPAQTLSQSSRSACSKCSHEAPDKNCTFQLQKHPNCLLYKHGKYLVIQVQDVVRCLTLHVSKSLLQPSSDVCTRYILLRCEVEKIKHFDRTPRLFIARSGLNLVFSF